MTEPPDVRQWLQHAGDQSGSQLVDALQHDQLQRWQRGERVPAEAYLQMLAGKLDDDEQALDLVYGEYLLRDQQGDSPSLAEYQWRFPQFAEQLRLLADLDEGLTLDAPAEPNSSQTTHRLANAHTDTFLPPPNAPTVPGYAIHEEVGHGGTGIVYRALQHGLNRIVAIKIIRSPDPEARARFRIEVEAVARLQHANIVQIHEVGEANDGRAGCPYMALEFVEGGSLAKRLLGGPLAPREARALVETISRAVHFAHQHGILHRDLKPGNVLLAGGRASEPIPKVADFGLAKRLEDLDSDQTKTGSIIGTPSYMAPEQAEGRTRDVGVVTDVYALGAILYETLTGFPPFKGETPFATLQEVRTRAPTPPRRVQPNVPRDLETICLKALRKEPADRYASAEALADDLRRYLHGEPILARRIGWPARVMKWCRRYPALTSTLAVALLAIATVAATSYLRVVRERDRYREEHNQAVANLYQSLVGEARALRLARAPGYRAEAFSRLQRALKLDTPARDPLAIRNEAIACLGDFVGLEPTAWDDMPSDDYAVDLGLSPDGQEVALGMTRGTVWIRDRRTGKQLARLEGHRAGVFGVKYGSSGNLLVSADDQGSIRVWARRGKAWECKRTLMIAPSGRPNYVHAISLALTPDEHRLFACSRSTKEIAVWDIETGKQLDSFRTPRNEPIYRAALSSDGRLLAAGLDPTANSEMVVWDVASHQLLHRFIPGLSQINDVVFSPTGKYLACACEGGVALYDTPDFRSRLFVRGDGPNAVAFSPDERLLAIPALEFGLVRLWNVQANREVALLKHSREPHAIGFTNDGDSLIGVGASLVHIWNLRGTGEKIVLPGHEGAVASVSFGPGGKTLFSSGSDYKIRIVDSGTGRLWSQLNRLEGLAVSTDGRTVMTIENDVRVKTWDVSDPARPRLSYVYNYALGKEVWSMAISPDGDWLAAAGESGLVLWKKGNARGTRLANGKLAACGFTPDSRKLVWSAPGGDHFFVRDCARGEQRSCPCEDLVLLRFPFFPDNRHVVQLSNKQELVVLDLETGARESTLGKLDFGGQSSFFMGRSAVLTGDGAWLAAQAPEIPVWNVDGRTLLFHLPLSNTLPTCLAWGNNRELLAVGSRDGEIVAWNIPKMRAQLQTLGLDW